MWADLPDMAQQLQEGGRPGKGGADADSAHEGPDQVFKLGHAAPSMGHPYHQVLLLQVAGQQHLEGCQQHHEHGGSRLHGTGADSVTEPDRSGLVHEVTFKAC